MISFNFLILIKDLESKSACRLLKELSVETDRPPDPSQTGEFTIYNFQFLIRDQYLSA